MKIFKFSLSSSGQGLKGKIMPAPPSLRKRGFTHIEVSEPPRFKRRRFRYSLNLLKGSEVEHSFLVGEFVDEDRDGNKIVEVSIHYEEISVEAVQSIATVLSRAVAVLEEDSQGSESSSEDGKEELSEIEEVVEEITEEEDDSESQNDQGETEEEETDPDQDSSVTEEEKEDIEDFEVTEDEEEDEEEEGSETSSKSSSNSSITSSQKTPAEQGCEAGSDQKRQGGQSDQDGLKSSNSEEGDKESNIDYKSLSSKSSSNNLEEVLGSMDAKASKAFRDLLQEAGIETPVEEVKDHKKFNDPYKRVVKDMWLEDFKAIRIKKGLSRRLKKVFDKLLGSDLTGEFESPRLDPKKLVVQLQKYSLNNIYREELDRGYVIVAVDMSGSMHGFEPLAKFAFDLALENHNVIFVAHDNMYPFYIVEEGRGRRVDVVKTEKVNEFYEDLVKERDVKHIININDLDGLDFSEALYKSLPKTKILHLDNYGCSFLDPTLSNEQFQGFKNVKYYIGVGSPEDVCDLIESDLI